VIPCSPRSTTSRPGEAVGDARQLTSLRPGQRSTIGHRYAAAGHLHGRCSGRRPADGASCSPDRRHRPHAPLRRAVETLASANVTPWETVVTFEPSAVWRGHGKERHTVKSRAAVPLTIAPLIKRVDLRARAGQAIAARQWNRADLPSVRVGAHGQPRRAESPDEGNDADALWRSPAVVARWDD